MNVQEIEGLEDLELWTNNLVKSFKTRHVLLLKGPLGVGKTQLVRFLLKAMKGEDLASSPTFSIHNSYQISDGLSLEHFDLYRIESDADLESTGFWEVFELQKGLICIEWPDRIHLDDIPKSWTVTNIQLEFDPQAPGTSARRISVG